MLHVILTALLSFVGVTLLAPRAEASMHEEVNRTRSSVVSHIFVSQSAGGEFGSMNYGLLKTKDEDSGETNVQDEKRSWQGYGFDTTVGIEALRFIQFNVGHTFVNMRSSSSSLENLSGSRLHGGARLVFMAPIGNLEFGGGALAGRYSYQKDLMSANYFSSGFYYSLGINYFLESRVSIFADAKMITERCLRNSGEAAAQSMILQSTNVSAGFSLWL